MFLIYRRLVMNIWLGVRGDWCDIVGSEFGDIIDVEWEEVNENLEVLLVIMKLRFWWLIIFLRIKIFLVVVGGCIIGLIVYGLFLWCFG